MIRRRKERATDSPNTRAGEIYSKYLMELALRTDRMFAILFGLQWIAGILFAFLLSPTTWSGDFSQTHVHVQSALVLGTAIAAYPIYLLTKYPGGALNRYVVAVAQALFSALFIHLTGGRIETHFHIFGSLALLSFYYDWKVIVVATLVATVDHLLRGQLWPQSVYGVLSANPWRAIEHASWMIFEDIFLFASIRRALDSMRSIADKQVVLETALNLAEQANQAESNFLANVSHGIQAPMHGILSFSKDGKQKAGTPDDKIKSYFDEIHQSGSNVMLLLNDLLDLSKLESGKAIFSMQKHRFEETIQSVFADLRSAAERRGLKLEYTVKEREIIGTFDREKIFQVIHNLISNAIKFSDRGTTIMLSLDYVTEDRRKVVFRITNQGIGIPPTELESIFDKFVQSSKTKKSEGGTGLGLAICRQIVQHHGGRIWAESGADGKTQFLFELPVFPNFAEMKVAA